MTLSDPSLLHLPPGRLLCLQPCGICLSSILASALASEVEVALHSPYTPFASPKEKGPRTGPERIWLMSLVQEQRGRALSRCAPRDDSSGEARCRARASSFCRMR